MQVCKLVTCYVQIMSSVVFTLKLIFNTSVKYHVPVQYAAILLGLTDSDGVIDVNSR